MSETVEFEELDDEDVVLVNEDTPDRATFEDESSSSRITPPVLSGVRRVLGSLQDCPVSSDVYDKQIFPSIPPISLRGGGSLFPARYEDIVDIDSAPPISSTFPDSNSKPPVLKLSENLPEAIVECDQLIFLWEVLKVNNNSLRELVNKYNHNDFTGFNKDDAFEKCLVKALDSSHVNQFLIVENGILRVRTLTEDEREELSLKSREELDEIVREDPQTGLLFTPQKITKQNFKLDLNLVKLAAQPELTDENKKNIFKGTAIYSYGIALLLPIFQKNLAELKLKSQKVISLLKEFKEADVTPETAFDRFHAYFQLLNKLENEENAKPEVDRQWEVLRLITTGRYQYEKRLLQILENIRGETHINATKIFAEKSPSVQRIEALFNNWSRISLQYKNACEKDPTNPEAVQYMIQLLECKWIIYHTLSPEELATLEHAKIDPKGFNDLVRLLDYGFFLPANLVRLAQILQEVQSIHRHPLTRTLMAFEKIVLTQSEFDFELQSGESTLKEFLTQDKSDFMSEKSLALWNTFQRGKRNLLKFFHYDFGVALSTSDLLKNLAIIIEKRGIESFIGEKAFRLHKFLSTDISQIPFYNKIQNKLFELKLKFTPRILDNFERAILNYENCIEDYESCAEVGVVESKRGKGFSIGLPEDPLAVQLESHQKRLMALLTSIKSYFSEEESRTLKEILIIFPSYSKDPLLVKLSELHQRMEQHVFQAQKEADFFKNFSVETIKLLNETIIKYDESEDQENDYEDQIIMSEFFSQANRSMILSGNLDKLTNPKLHILKELAIKINQRMYLTDQALAEFKLMFPERILVNLERAILNYEKSLVNGGNLGNDQMKLESHRIKLQSELAEIQTYSLESFQETFHVVFSVFPDLKVVKRMSKIDSKIKEFVFQNQLEQAFFEKFSPDLILKMEQIFLQYELTCDLLKEGATVEDISGNKWECFTSLDKLFSQEDRDTVISGSVSVQTHPKLKVLKGLAGKINKLSIEVA